MIGWQDVRREPFRLFFPLGVLLGLIGVGHWLGYATGVAAAASGFFHAWMQVGGFLTCIIVGFLLTALPRFAAATPSTTLELLVLLSLAAAQPILLSLGRWMAAEWCFIAILVGVAVFAGRRFAKRKASTGPPTEFVWVGIAIVHGVLGALLLIGGQAGRLPASALIAGRQMVQQGFVLSVILGVGGFLAPRLMGRGLASVMATASARQVKRLRLRRALLHLFAGAWLLWSFWLEGQGAVRLAYLLRAAVVTAELAWTTQFLLPPIPPRIAEGYVRLLWASLWALVLGLWGAALWPRYRVGWLHVTFIGGFTLMVFSVATMVVLSHGGQPHRLRQPLWILRVVAAGVLSAVITRVMAPYDPAHFFLLVGISAACWISAAGSWLAFALPVILRPADPEAFERLHERVKREPARDASRRHPA